MWFLCPPTDTGFPRHSPRTIGLDSTALVRDAIPYGETRWDEPYITVRIPGFPPNAVNQGLREIWALFCAAVIIGSKQPVTLVWGLAASELLNERASATWVSVKREDVVHPGRHT